MSIFNAEIGKLHQKISDNLKQKWYQWLRNTNGRPGLSCVVRCAERETLPSHKI